MSPTKPQPATRIRNHGRGHSYLLDGEKVPGVTSVLDAIAKPGLIKWAAETTYGYAIDHWAELSELPVSERIKRLERARFERLGEAAERGREVHAQVVRFLAGEEIVPPAGLEGHVDAAIRFVEEWHLEELLVEAPVFSREFGYAGRLDLLARLADGAAWLLDFKTHAKGPFTESALQLAGYRYADFYVVPGELDDDGQAVEHPMPHVDRAGIVHVRADGYDLYPYDAGDEAFRIFGAAQEIAAFLDSPRDRWIGDALRPPALEEAVA
jgi:hypothetical protein